MAMGIAAIRGQDVTRETYRRLVEIADAVPMDSFIDGPRPVRVLIKRALQGAALVAPHHWPGILAALRRLRDRRGLNHGSAFEQWFEAILQEEDCGTTGALYDSLQTVWADLEDLRQMYVDGPGQDPVLASPIDGNPALALHPGSALLQLITMAMPVGIKFKLPQDLHYLSPEYQQSSPARLVRTSMSIPAFFEPVVMKTNPQTWPLRVQTEVADLVSVPQAESFQALKELLFLDGGMMSNLPSDSFRDLMPDVPTVVVPLVHGGAAKPITRRKRLADLVGDAVAATALEIMPAETATAQVDYVLEDAARGTISAADKLSQLRDGSQDASGGPEYETFRMVNTTLEQTFQSLLDQLTAMRIAEEMDAPTYLERMRGAYRRAKDGARAHGARMTEHAERAQRLVTRLSLAHQIVAFMSGEVRQRVKETPDHDAVQADLSATFELLERGQTFAAHYEMFTRLSADGLLRMQQEFVTDKIRDSVESEALRVSRAIERQAIFRSLPLIWALLISLMVKIVLAHNTSEALHGFSPAILAFSFVATWALSIYLGVWGRSRRMSDLRAYTQAQMREVLSISERPKTSYFQRGLAQDDVIEFPRIPAGHTPAPRRTLVPYNYEDRAFRAAASVVRRNLLALLIPLLLAMVVLVMRKDEGYAFVARFEGAEPCILASGDMVFATSKAYYILPDARVNTLPERVLRHIFPSLLADVLSRENVLRVELRDGTGPAALAPCATQRVGANGITVVTGGDADSHAVADASVQALTRAVQDVAVALGATQTVTLDFETFSDGLTVDLGDNSLSVLQQAILDAGPGPAPIITDPAIIDARTAILLALDVDTPEAVDVSRIFAELNIITERLGGDVSVAQALNVVFGGPDMTSRLVLSPEFEAFLQGGAGGQDLIAELGELRLAFEAANALAARFMAVIEMEGDEETAITVIDSHLTAIMDRQDTLIAAINALISQDPEALVTSIIERQDLLVAAVTALRDDVAGDTVLLAPVIFDIASGDSLPLPPPVGDEGPPVITRETGVFQTLILSEGSAGAEPPVSIANVLVLPFWSSPVESVLSDLDSPQGIWDWAIQTDNLTDPQITDSGGTYFGRIADTLVGCLAEDARLEIDILGLASRSWAGPISDTPAPVLNYYLAEGRRIAALRRLEELIDDPALSSRIDVQLADGTFGPMAGLIDTATSQPDIVDGLPAFARFASLETFENRRDKLLNVTGLNSDTATPLEELFGRSVVLRMVSGQSGPCEF